MTYSRSELRMTSGDRWWNQSPSVMIVDSFLESIWRNSGKALLQAYRHQRHTSTREDLGGPWRWEVLFGIYIFSFSVMKAHSCLPQSIAVLSCHVRVVPKSARLASKWNIIGEWLVRDQGTLSDWDRPIILVIMMHMDSMPVLQQNLTLLHRRKDEKGSIRTIAVPRKRRVSVK